MSELRYPVEIERLPLAARFEVRGREAEMKSAMKAAGLGWPGTMHQRHRDAKGRELVRLGPTRLLVQAPAELESEIAEGLEAACSRSPTVDVALVSDMFVGFRVRGPGATDVLRQGAPLDLSDKALPPGKATGTELWAVTAIVMRGMAPEEGFTILVDNAYSGYLEDWLAVAAGAPSRARPGVMASPPGQVPA